MKALAAQLANVFTPSTAADGMAVFGSLLTGFGSLLIVLGSLLTVLGSLLTVLGLK